MKGGGGAADGGGDPGLRSSPIHGSRWASRRGPNRLPDGELPGAVMQGRDMDEVREMIQEAVSRRVLALGSAAKSLTAHDVLAWTADIDDVHPSADNRK